MKCFSKLIFILLSVLCLMSCSKENSCEFKIKNTEVKLPYEKIYSATRYNNQLYVAVKEEKQYGLASVLLKYDIENKSTKMLFRSKYLDSAIQKPKVNKRWLVWQDANASGNTSEIYAKNLEEDEIKLLSKLGNPEKYKNAPALYENYAVFAEENEDGKVVVQLYNLETDEIKEIGIIHSPSLLNDSIEFKKGIVAYTDNVNNQYLYKTYNMKEGKEDTYKFTQKKDIGYTQIVGNELLALSFEDVQRWESQKWVSINMKNGKEAFNILPKEGLPIHMFKTGENRVYIKDLKGNLIVYTYSNSKFKKEFIVKSTGYFSIDNSGRLLTINEEAPSTIVLISKDCEKEQ
ncbi:hypothetical protein COL26_24125 [Bacillus thuringiensis]|uniref:Lipoprotein n=1 Tax=Bacillus thuringiensis TaxID=1428 RepID=A0ABD6S4H7_BACTU|nr:hypothetical protein [Bacillus thuringiensis]PER43869.1 hypothetical protein CN495_30305 [Bacillus thuringiensis]PEU96425.1 hypothetical protein CN411_02495 [Bacillus thuringiensis]PFI03269.1 hypothetical protein COI79_29480 [Bacillus thuringiensis]PFW33206.1 hypothetical protein COL26_24125 [Bacillus thuringiensis]PGY75550.1 hypothetical protein COE44_19605 [Bacillus thuringiensis]